MTTPEWLKLRKNAKKAVDDYIADQRTRFGEVVTIPTNAILDRMENTSQQARIAAYAELRSRGWAPDQKGHARARSWSKPEGESDPLRTLWAVTPAGAAKAQRGRDRS